MFSARVLVYAQAINSGMVTGTATDESGALVSAANVSIRNRPQTASRLLPLTTLDRFALTKRLGTLIN